MKRKNSFDSDFEEEDLQDANDVLISEEVGNGALVKVLDTLRKRYLIRNSPEAKNNPGTFLNSIAKAQFELYDFEDSPYHLSGRSFVLGSMADKNTHETDYSSKRKECPTKHSPNDKLYCALGEIANSLESLKSNGNISKNLTIKRRKVAPPTRGKTLLEKVENIMNDWLTLTDEQLKEITIHQRDIKCKRLRIVETIQSSGQTVSEFLSQTQHVRTVSDLYSYCNKCI